MRAKAHRRRQLHRDTDAMTYDGPSQEEFLAELRSRRPSTEVILHRAPLSHPRTERERGQTVSSLRISRHDDPDNPVPARASTSSLWLRTTLPDPTRGTKPSKMPSTRRSFRIRGASQRVDASAGRCLAAKEEPAGDSPRLLPFAQSSTASRDRLIAPGRRNSSEPGLPLVADFAWRRLFVVLTREHHTRHEPPRVRLGFQGWL